MQLQLWARQFASRVLISVLIPTWVPALAGPESCQLLEPAPTKRSDPGLPPPPAPGPVAPRTKKYVTSLTSDDRHQFDGSMYAVVTHAEKSFDQDKTSEGVMRLLQTAKRNSIASIGVIASPYRDQHFKSSDVDDLIESMNGDHKLRFPNATDFIIGGGNLSFCLCETIRDLIRNTDSKRPLRLILVADAIYDLHGTPATVNRSKPFNLATCTSSARAETYNHLVRIFSAKDKVCGDYVSFSTVALETKNLRFRFSMNGRPLGPDVGSGQRRIEIAVTSSEELSSFINSERSSGAPPSSISAKAVQ